MTTGRYADCHKKNSILYKKFSIVIFWMIVSSKPWESRKIHPLYTRSKKSSVYNLKGRGSKVAWRGVCEKVR